MPSFLTTTTRAASSPVNNNNKKENNNNASTKKSQKSLKPSSEASRKANQKQQISVPSSTPLPGKEFVRKNIGTTLSLTLAVGIGYFLGNNPTQVSEIFGKTFGGRSSASASEEAEMVVLNEGKNETYTELFSIDTMDSATKANQWRVVNDGVMGGVSNSAMIPPSPNSPGFSRFAGVYVKCKAAMKERDEKKQFLLLAKDVECSRNFGTNFKSAFTVKSADDWEVKLFPFEKCFKKGERMGRPIERGPINVKEVTELGLMILRGEEAQVGKFGLDVEEFGFYV
ncbi:unnamed protein product [Bathycoccus prasinos]